MQTVYAAAEANERRKKTRGGASVADKDLQRILFGTGIWDFTAVPFNFDPAIAELQLVRQNLYCEAQLTQSFDHYLRILAPQGAFKRGFSVRQGGQDQSAIGDALRAWNRDLGVDRFVQRNDFDEVREHQGLITPLGVTCL